MFPLLLGREGGTEGTERIERKISIETYAVDHSAAAAAAVRLLLLLLVLRIIR